MVQTDNLKRNTSHFHSAFCLNTLVYKYLIIIYTYFLTIGLFSVQNKQRNQQKEWVLQMHISPTEVELYNTHQNPSWQLNTVRKCLPSECHSPDTILLVHRVFNLMNLNIRSNEAENLQCKMPFPSLHNSWELFSVLFWLNACNINLK